jgi:putative oxidoreductase
VTAFSRLLSRLEPGAYAAFRIVSGAMFALHGAQKILGWFSSKPGPAFGSQLWLGGMIELVCGVLIAVGLFTRGAAFLASGTMAVAYLQFHWKLSFEGWNVLPIVNKGELAVLYCFAFLFVAARGAGGCAVDSTSGSVRNR